MKLLELNKTTWEVEIAPEAAILEVFNKIIKRDKSKLREIAKKELGFIYHLVDVRSEYIAMEEPDKTNIIIKDLDLPAGWKPDKLIQEGIAYYRERRSINESLYEGAIIAANVVNSVLRESKTLMESSGDKFADIQKVLAALDKLPKAMANLNAANQELVKEQKITEGRTKGSKELNLFEDGI